MAGKNIKRTRKQKSQKPKFRNPISRSIQVFFRTISEKLSWYPVHILRKPIPVDVEYYVHEYENAETKTQDSEYADFSPEPITENFCDKPLHILSLRVPLTRAVPALSLIRVFFSFFTILFLVVLIYDTFFGPEN